MKYNFNTNNKKGNFLCMVKPEYTKIQMFVYIKEPMLQHPVKGLYLIMQMLHSHRLHMDTSKSKLTHLPLGSMVMWYQITHGKHYKYDIRNKWPLLILGVVCSWYPQVFRYCRNYFNCKLAERWLYNNAFWT